MTDITKPNPDDPDVDPDVPNDRGARKDFHSPFRKDKDEVVFG